VQSQNIHVPCSTEKHQNFTQSPTKQTFHYSLHTFMSNSPRSPYQTFTRYFITVGSQSPHITAFTTSNIHQQVMSAAQQPPATSASAVTTGLLSLLSQSYQPSIHSDLKNSRKNLYLLSASQRLPLKMLHVLKEILMLRIQLQLCHLQVFTWTCVHLSTNRAN